MTLPLSKETERLLKRRIGAGGYASPDAAIRAAFLVVADAEIDRGEVLDGHVALKQRRARRANRSKKAG